MKTRHLEEIIAYDGAQLRAHWILRHTGIAGDALVAFRGPCEVTDAEMADLEDLLDGPGIAGADMLHFLMEIFDDGDLLRAVYRQRLFTALALDTLRAMTSGADVRRVGDDLFVDTRKLSISIATHSPVSTLIHFALNVSNEGTPVPTVSLEELGVEVNGFARSVLAAAAEEHRSILEARAKVRAKGEA